MTEIATTCFAPAPRAEPAAVRRLSHRFYDGGFFGQLMDHLPCICVLLNQQRQIVYANHRALEAGGAKDPAAVIGLRLGELLGCKNVTLTSGGCGTTGFCGYCGAARATLASQAGPPAVEECRILVQENNHEEAMDLRIRAFATEFDGEPLTFLTIDDIAEEKRRAFLEESFLHDVINTSMALREFSTMLCEGSTDRSAHATYAKRLLTLSGHLVEEVKSHALLTAAENDRLELDVRHLDSLQLLNLLLASYDRPELLDDRVLVLGPESEAVQFQSDQILLSRVLLNMIKNAIEASPRGATVTVGCRQVGNEIEFWVHNPTHMSREVQHQVFYRNFSTKGRGRGLGTYSMKYFTEKYLHGTLSFTSAEEKGTTFVARYPLVRTQNSSPAKAG